MRLNLKSLILIFGPVFFVAVLDLLIKDWVLTHPHLDFGFAQVQATLNKGIIGGYLSGQAKPIFQIPMVTLGFFLLVCLYLIQLLAPIRSTVMRFGISLYFGGVFANVLDRVFHGYVTDFLIFHLGSIKTPAFNIADLFQYAGILVMLIWQFRPGTFDDSYADKLWVSRGFQKRYSYLLVKMGFFLILVFGALSYTFVSVALQEVSMVEQMQQKLMQDYLVFFLSTAVTFLIFLFLIGKALSAYVAKPILQFEHYLRSLASGDYHIFEVDEPEFQYLEELSDDVRDHLMEIHHQLGRQKIRRNKGPLT